MLVEANLASEFLKLVDSASPSFSGFPSSKADATTNWAQAYNTYALSAQDASEDLVASVSLPGMISTLLAQLPDSATGTPDLAAAAFDSAFVQYWTGAIFAVGIPPTGLGACPNAGGTSVFSSEISSVVTAVTANVLKDLLLPIFNSINDGIVASQLLATAFHTATTSAVIVLITGLDTTPAPAGPLPITNTCGIH
jgi:hypothetical protein